MFGLLKQKTVPMKWRIISTFAFLSMLVVNGLAGSTTLIGGTGTAAVSDKYTNLFTPAGFTFAVWSVIYVLLAYFLTRVWGFWSPKKPRLDAATVTTVLKLFSVTSAINIAWLFA